MIYSAFKPILALHIVNFSICQNYWGGGGGGKRYVSPPPPHISTLFLSVHLGVLPPQYQKAGYATGAAGMVAIIQVCIQGTCYVHTCMRKWCRISTLNFVREKFRKWQFTKQKEDWHESRKSQLSCRGKIITKKSALEGNMSSLISGWSAHKLSHRTHMLNCCGKIF